MSIRLADGDRVCIVGGGPAGSFAALHLLAGAARRGVQLQVFIFEPHQPLGPGPKSCKGCAGILSNGAVRNMATLGLTVPPEVIQSELHAYVVHVAGQVTSIVQPDPRRRILSVYRGAGPRLMTGERPSSFDAWLLSQAIARGATHVAARVRRVEWEDGPVACTDDGRFPGALLVLATGVNSRPPLSEAFGYRAPGTAPMVQDEIPRPDNWPAGKVAGFFGQPPGLIFGAMVPKGRFLNVSLMWRGDPADAIQRFYSAQSERLSVFFPEGQPQSLCGCNPRILRTPAPVFYGDRWVAVGDASVARLYKDGMNSAFLTSGRAVRAALDRGICAESFREGYEPLCQEMALDNRYGALLYRLSAHILGNPVLANACIGRVRTEAGLVLDRRVYSQLLWGMLTGDEHYRDLFRLFFKPHGILGLGRELLRLPGRQPPEPSEPLL